MTTWYWVALFGGLTTAFVIIAGKIFYIIFLLEKMHIQLLVTNRLLAVGLVATYGRERSLRAFESKEVKDLVKVADDFPSKNELP